MAMEQHGVRARRIVSLLPAPKSFKIPQLLPLFVVALSSAATMISFFKLHSLGSAVVVPLVIAASSSRGDTPLPLVVAVGMLALAGAALLGVVAAVRDPKKGPGSALEDDCSSPFHISRKMKVQLLSMLCALLLPAHLVQGQGSPTPTPAAAATCAIIDNFLYLSDEELFNVFEGPDSRIGDYCHIRYIPGRVAACNYYVVAAPSTITDFVGWPRTSLGDAGTGCVYEGVEGPTKCFVNEPSYDLSPEQRLDMCSEDVVGNAAAQLRHAINSGACCASTYTPPPTPPPAPTAEVCGVIGSRCENTFDTGCCPGLECMNTDFDVSSDNEGDDFFLHHCQEPTPTDACRDLDSFCRGQNDCCPGLECVPLPGDAFYFSYGDLDAYGYFHNHICEAPQEPTPTDACGVLDSFCDPQNDCCTGLECVPLPGNYYHTGSDFGDFEGLYYGEYYYYFSHICQEPTPTDACGDLDSFCRGQDDCCTGLECVPLPGDDYYFSYGDLDGYGCCNHMCQAPSGTPTAAPTEAPTETAAPSLAPSTPATAAPSPAPSTPATAAPSPAEAFDAPAVNPSNPSLPRSLAPATDPSDTGDASPSDGGVTETHSASDATQTYYYHHSSYSSHDLEGGTTGHANCRTDSVTSPDGEDFVYGCCGTVLDPSTGEVVPVRSSTTLILLKVQFLDTIRTEYTVLAEYDAAAAGVSGCAVDVEVDNDGNLLVLGVSQRLAVLGPEPVQPNVETTADGGRGLERLLEGLQTVDGADMDSGSETFLLYVNPSNFADLCGVVQGIGGGGAGRGVSIVRQTVDELVVRVHYIDGPSQDISMLDEASCAGYATQLGIGTDVPVDKLYIDGHDSGVFVSTFLAVGVVLVALAGVFGVVGATSTSRGPQPSAKSPSSASAKVMIQHVQGLALLAFAVPAERRFSDFARALSWTNLWWTVDFLDNNEEEGIATDGSRQLSGEGEDSCGGQETVKRFVGNLLLAGGLVLIMVLLNLVLGSYIEAKWQAREKAKLEWRVAQRVGITRGADIRMHLTPSPKAASRKGDPALPSPPRPESLKGRPSVTALPAARSESLSLSSRAASAALGVAYRDELRAAAEWDRAQWKEDKANRGLPAKVPSFYRVSGVIEQPQNHHLQQQYQQQHGRGRGIEACESNSSVGGMADPIVFNTTAFDGYPEPPETPKFWTYYPHVLLVVMVFILEGTSLAEMGVMTSNCDWAVAVGVLTFLLLPCLIALYCGGFVVKLLRQKSDSAHQLVFVRYEDEEEEEEGNDAADGDGSSRQVKNQKVGVWEKVKRSMSATFFEEERFLSCFDTGAWMTVYCNEPGLLAAASEQHQHNLRREQREGSALEVSAQRALKVRKRVAEAELLRIGNEPIYADFTDTGLYYALFLYVEILALASVAAFVPDETTQLIIFLAFTAVNLLFVVMLRPFCNSELNLVAGVGAGVNLLMLALLLTMQFDGYAGGEFERRGTNAIYVMQVVFLVTVSLPLYFDALLGLWQAALSAWRSDDDEDEAGVTTSMKTKGGKDVDTVDNHDVATLRQLRREDRQAFLNTRTRENWKAVYGKMLRKNFRHFRECLRLPLKNPSLATRGEGAEMAADASAVGSLGSLRSELGAEETGQDTRAAPQENTWENLLSGRRFSGVA